MSGWRRSAAAVSASSRTSGAKIACALPPAWFDTRRTTSTGESDEVGDVGISLGTSGVVLSPSASSVVDREGVVDSVCDATGGYLPLACTLNAAKVTDTFARLLGVDHAEMERLALAAPPDASPPVLVAYLDGERTPRRPDAVGVLGNITTSITREELALAAYRGVVTGLQVCLGAL